MEKEKKKWVRKKPYKPRQSLKYSQNDVHYLANLTFVELTLPHELPSGKFRPQGKFVCNLCGNTMIKNLGQVRVGKVRSCNDCRYKYLLNLFNRFTGLNQTKKLDRLQLKYANLLDKMYIPNSYEYPTAGGKGVVLSDEFLNWEFFKKYAIDSGYTSKHNLYHHLVLPSDKIQYLSPDNISWKTSEERIKEWDLTFTFGLILPDESFRPHSY